MINRKIVYYPNNEHRNSPLQYIGKLEVNGNKKDANKILNKISIVARTRYPEIEINNVKQIGNVYQYSIDAHRVYFAIIQNNTTIVVTHICRKVSRKAKKQDLDMAENNLSEYLARKEWKMN